MNKILNGSANPAAIDAALDSVADMSGLRSQFNITSTDVENLAEYLFFAGAGQNCPAPTPNVSASPPSLSFGSVNVGASSAAQVVTISNTGAANATGLNYPAAPAHFSRTTTCGATLNAGASCTATFTFSPTAAGTFNPTWTITGGGGVSVPIALSGTGAAAAAANLQASPASLSFGSVTVGQTSSAQSVTVTNTGGATATGVALSNPNATEFIVSANTCGSSLAAGASCGFSVAYRPSAVGGDNATLSINYTGGSRSVAMSGTGAGAAAASLSALPPLVSFGNVTVGQSSSSVNVAVNNTGGAAATGVSMSNSNPGEFQVSGNTCGSTINAGGGCSLTVRYTPSAAGSDTATLTFNFVGGSLVISLSGNGVTVAAQGQLSMPLALSLPGTNVGSTSAPQTVTLSNTGTAAVTVAAITSNSSEFGIGGVTCTIVNAGASCSFTVTFTPALAGARSAAITVTSNGTGSPQAITASGTGVSGGTANTALAIEYYHQQNDHYFVTWVAAEIDNLDSGRTTGWMRTNQSFKVFTAPQAGAAAVCRIYIPPGLGDGHFFGRDANECNGTMINNPTFFLESSTFFYLYPPNLGNCAAGTVPVYRVFSNRVDANHRYTTDRATRDFMVTAKKWLAEGDGADAVVMCAPP